MNYQIELDKILAAEGKKDKTVFLHSCCAPCSSYCLEYLCKYFAITVFYYNPNISASEEYWKRMESGGRKSFTYEEVVPRAWKIRTHRDMLVHYLEQLQMDLDRKESI